MRLSRRLSGWLRASILLSIALTTGAAYCSAQSDPLLSQGLGTVSEAKGSDFEEVRLDQGILFAHIPLISYPQRGKLQLGFSLLSSTNEYITKQTCNSKGTSCTTAWNVIGNPFTFGVQVVEDGSIFLDPLQLGNPMRHAVTPDGSYHSLWVMNTGTTLIEGTTTVDGTAIKSILDFTGPKNPQGQLQGVYYLLDRDGTRYSGNSQRQDTNGNVITHSAGIYTDTLGRSIPSPLHGELGNSTTDFTGCQGPLATASANNWQVPGPNGTTSNFKFCFAAVATASNFALNTSSTGLVPEIHATRTMLQSVVLPNGTVWVFEYNSRSPGDPSSVNYGDLTKITTPTGGSISYTYETAIWKNVMAQRLVTSRSIDANDGTGPHTWNYAWSPAYTPGTTTTTELTGVTMTDPLGNDTVAVIANFSDMLNRVTKETLYQGSQTTGTLLLTRTTDWATIGSPVPNGTPTQSILPIRETTTWANGATKKIEKDYDTQVNISGYGSIPNYTASNGNVLAVREYDYGSGGAPGPLIRTTTTAYEVFANSVYANTNQLFLPASVTVTDGAGNTKQLTSYSYDQESLIASGVTTQFSATQLGTNNPNGTARGNLTTVQRWLNLPSSTNLSTTTQHFDTGMPYQVTDPGGHTTTYSNSATFAGAYPTQVTNALSQSASQNYEFDTGEVISSIDPNSLQTTSTYDPMWRLSQNTYPNGGQESITRQESSLPFSVTISKKLNSSQNVISQSVLDGLGRVTQTQLLSDPQGTVFKDTTYDSVGRVATVSNPYRKGGDPTSSPGTTSFAYDALGRKISETYPDGSVLTTAYCSNSILVTDPTGHWRRSRTDGLGRLVEVDEPNAVGATVAATGCPGTGEAIFITSYSYDVLGNLTQVVQNGSHQRTFTYDSVSRLLTSNNPESGTITYTYTSDGFVSSKTDARGIKATYTYDALHREKTRSYSNSDPTISFNYDEANCLGLSACQNIGHRTSMTDAAGSETWSNQVDATNQRSVHVNQRTNSSTPTSVTKTSTYYFNLAGGVTQTVYPTGRVINYSYDSAGRPSSATDGSSGITYATDFQTPPANTNCVARMVCYTPQGSFYALSIGQSTSFTGFNINHTFNTRLQPIEFKASSTGGNAIDITYSFVDPTSSKDAGHVNSITNSLNPSRSQSFTYDQLNRIKTAGTSATTGQYCWGYDYSSSYDAWGNLQSQPGAAAYTGCSETIPPAMTADGNNHLSGLTYDASGNTLTDGANTYTWNAESQMKTAAGVTYAYDGDGRRVSKSNGKLYWYGSGSEILAETDASGNTTNEYIFFGGQRIATLPAGSAPLYYAEDFLGSSRVMVTSTGIVCYDADFTPFGGERAYTNTCAQNYKFEGKERDTETGNDDFGARYYSNRLGRWLSSDWSAVPVAVPYANLTNPQTLNLYSMVADDPESFADLDGHVCPCIVDAVDELLESPAVQHGLGILAGAAAAAWADSKGLFDKAADFLIAHPMQDTQMAPVEFAMAFAEPNKDSKPETTTEDSSRHKALNDAKRDANVPTSQQPEKQENAPVTDANGKQVVNNGKPQTSREYTHTTGDGKKVVIQDHKAGHNFKDGKKTGSHFNVRPPDDTRHGTVPGTQPHYPYRDHD